MWAVGLTEPERFDERCNVTEVVNECPTVKLIQLSSELTNQ